MENCVSSRVKKLGALVLAMVFTLTLSIPAFAATLDANMTSDYSQWTVEVAPGSSVTLYASPANSSYTATGFDANATTDQVSWTSSNTSIATVSSVGFENAPASVSGLTGIYCTKAMVTVPATATIGSCSIEAKNLTTNAYVNFTIVVDSSVTATASDATIYLPDYEKTFSMDTVNHTARNFATPMDAFIQLKADSASGFSYTGSSSYVSSITYDGVQLEEYTDYDATTGEYAYYGWNYRVYRQSGNDSYLIGDSAVLSADTFKLQSNDTVVWMYGTMDAAESFFTNALSDLYV